MISFQFCILVHWNTVAWSNWGLKACCDKLSILYLSSLKYSLYPRKNNYKVVVISFQFCILVHWNTVWKFSREIFICCDKLSILYLSSLKYSIEISIPKVRLVVISFQFCILVHWNTVRFTHIFNSFMLW